MYLAHTLTEHPDLGNASILLYFLPMFVIEIKTIRVAEAPPHHAPRGYYPSPDLGVCASHSCCTFIISPHRYKCPGSFAVAVDSLVPSLRACLGNRGGLSQVVLVQGLPWVCRIWRPEGPLPSTVRWLSPAPLLSCHVDLATSLSECPRDGPMVTPE